MILPDFQGNPDAIPSAILSGDGRYRYLLTRRVQAPPDRSQGKKAVLFVMLNPSTADAIQDDATIRRCIGYVGRWGYGWLWVCNLLPLRTPKPSVLQARGPDPEDVRAVNFRMTFAAASAADLVIAAWGAHGHWDGRDTAILELLQGIPLLCLGKTAGGQPRHPLYLKTDAALLAFP